MKSLRLTVAILALWPALAILTGCAQKKPVLVKPQQAPPTATAEPSPTPAPTPEAAQPSEAAQAQPAQATTPEQANPESADEDKAQKRKKPSPRVPASGTSQKPAGEARKKVIQADKTEPPPPGGQISPGPTPADANSQASTDQLLQSAETNLNAIKRQLSKEEEAMRAQVKEFIAQSRKATGENDPARAHNFAVKARWLSDELVKQR